MGTYTDKLATHIHDHLKQITVSAGLPDTPESLEEVARAWLEKSEIFSQKVSEYGMQSAGDFSPETAKGALVLTYSGSILVIGPKTGGEPKAPTRFVAYSSIGLRKDVPTTATHESAEFAGTVETDAPIEFNRGPVQKTSPVYKIAVSVEALPSPEERQKLLEATQVIAGEFVEVNKTIISG